HLHGRAWILPRLFKKFTGLLISFQQLLDCVTEGSVTGAGFLQPTAPFLGRQLDCRLENGLFASLRFVHAGCCSVITIHAKFMKKNSHRISRHYERSLQSHAVEVRSVASGGSIRETGAASPRRNPGCNARELGEVGAALNRIIE